jgi:hypothetical protein
MDSILVVCYSYTGTARRVAQLLSSHHGWPLGQVVETRSRAGTSGYLRSVLDSLLRRRPPVRYEGPDPSDFRTVVLVAPIWAYRLASPMRSFVAAHRASLGRVAVINTMGGAGASNAVAEVAALTGHAPVAALALTQRSVDDGTGTGELLAFGDTLVPGSAARGTPAAAPAWSGHGSILPDR